MAIIETDFIDGVKLTYPIGVHPQLFAVLNTRTKRKFFEEMNRLDGKDGEGTTPEQTVSMFHVGLMSSVPGITYKQAEEHVQNYIYEHGDTDLMIKLIDAFVDSGLLDRNTVRKNRERFAKKQALADELEALQDARNAAKLKKSWDEVDQLSGKIQNVSEELIETVENPEEVNDPAPLDPENKA